LPAGVASLLRGLTLLDVVDSTSHALARRPAAERHAQVVLADTQTAGRGRRQRRWHSPPGSNLYLSCGWHFDETPATLASLPLACAVIAADELGRLDAGGVRIKWPNDLFLESRKLGGILVESSIARKSCADVIVGIGINVNMRADESASAAIDQPWTDLASRVPAAGAEGFRDRLAGRLIGGLLAGLCRFGAEGFAPFHARWQRYDAVAGCAVVVTGDDGAQTGTALGITPNGALRVQLDAPAGTASIREFLAGEVSIRRVTGAAT